jgi:hypothetical protein
MIAVLTDLTNPDGTWRTARLDGLREQADIEIGTPPTVTGRLVGPLLRFARLTGHDPASVLATRLADHVDKIAFDEEGRLTGQAGGHVHSITSTISGLCQLAAESGDPARLRRAVQIFENAPAPWRSSFGWVKELIGPSHLGGEVNSTGDLIQAALILARAGVPALYAEAETMLRGHLLPSQIMGEGALPSAWTRGAQEGNPVQDEVVASMLGGFGFPTPGDRAPRHYDEPYVRITTLDITAGAVQAMCYSLESATERVGDDLRIHLLLDRQGPACQFRMLDLDAGLYEMVCERDAVVEVRLPRESVRERVRFTPFGGGSLRLPEGRPGYVRVEGWRGVSGYLSMPPAHRCMHEVLVDSRFDVEYVGEQLTAVTPVGPISPITGRAGRESAPERSTPTHGSDTGVSFSFADATDQFEREEIDGVSGM